MRPLPLIYLAGPWARRDEVRAVRDRLVAEGFNFTSRWIDIDETTTTPTAEAWNDLDDIDSADMLVVLNLEKSEGKAFEQGYAYANGKTVVVIGTTRLNIFQTLMEQYPDIDSFIAAYAKTAYTNSGGKNPFNP